MKVLQIAIDYLASPIFKNMFYYLSEAGVECKVFVPAKRGKLGKKHENLWICPCFNTLDRILYFTKQNSIYRMIEGEWHEKGFDLIHSHTLFSGGFASMKLGEKLGIPYVVTVNNTDVNCFLKYMPHLRSTGLRIMRNAARIVFVSPAYRNQILTKYVPAALRNNLAKKMVVLPYGIDSYYLEHKSSPRRETPKTPHFIQIGTIDPNKNLYMTVKSISLLRKEGIDADLTVLGKIKNEHYWNKLKGTRFLRYAGVVPKEQVAEYLRKSDIFILPSHKETFGLVYGEAISQGLPILYSNGQGFDGQFDNGQVGFAVNPDNPKDIADKALMLLKDYQAFSQKCIEGAKKFSWENVTRLYKDMYERIVRG